MKKGHTYNEIVDDILNIANDFSNVDTEAEPDDSFAVLAFDQVDTSEFIMKVEEHFNIDIPEEIAEEFDSLPEIISYIWRTYSETPVPEPEPEMEPEIALVNMDFLVDTTVFSRQEALNIFAKRFNEVMLSAIQPASKWRVTVKGAFDYPSVTRIRQLIEEAGFELRHTQEFLDIQNKRIQTVFYVSTTDHNPDFEFGL